MNIHEHGISEKPKTIKINLRESHNFTAILFHIKQMVRMEIYRSNKKSLKVRKNEAID